MNFTDAKIVWDYASKQPNANIVGPLGKRAGLLDVKEHYSNIIKFDLFPDARMWVQVGLGDASKDIFDQSHIDDGNMSMDVAYRALDTSKVDYEIYLIERTFFNVPYMFITIVMDNKDNDHMRYTRPAGLYWDKLVEKGLAGDELKIDMTYDPEMPVIEGGEQVVKTMRYTPAFYGMNHLDRPHDDGSGGWCPQKGGDWGSYPTNPGGSGFPNQYEEATPVCDGLVVDIMPTLMYLRGILQPSNCRMLVRMKTHRYTLEKVRSMVISQTLISSKTDLKTRISSISQRPTILTLNLYKQ